MWTEIQVHNIAERILLWLVNHGFEPTNREWATLILLAVLTVFSLTQPKVRSSLVSALRVAAGHKLILMFVGYIVWLYAFTRVAGTVDIWRPSLTKDTVLWGSTTGFWLLMKTNEIKDIGFFHQKLLKIVSSAAIFEYIIGIASFSIIVEIVTRALLFLVIVLPYAAEDSEQKDILTSLRNNVSILISSALFYHSIREIQSMWGSVNFSSYLIEAVWPLMLEIWLLVFMLPLAILMSYELAFLRVSMYSDTNLSPWKAKLGLLLALRFRFQEIKEAEKGGAITYDVAYSDSIYNAYKEAKKHRSDPGW